MGRKLRYLTSALGYLKKILEKIGINLFTGIQVVHA
jgi:hypothetical protein